MPTREWYSFITSKADAAGIAEINVFGPIGKSWADDTAVTAQKFIADLKALPSSVRTLRVKVNSLGGDPFDATAIANHLRMEQREQRGRRVEVSIEGIAASAATIITSAGAPIKIADNALFMVHEPRGIAVGPAALMRQVATALDRVGDSIVATYRWTSHLSAEALRKLMADETWMDAASAVKNGFATEIIKGTQVTAYLSPETARLLGDVPDRHKARVAALLGAPGSRPAAAAGESVFDLYARRNARRLESAAAHGQDYARLNARGSR